MLDFDRFQLFTFDCYGTLIDWEAGICGALQRVLKRHGVEVSNDELLELYAGIEAGHEQGEYKCYEDVLIGVMADIAAHYAIELDADETTTLARSVKHWQPFPDTVAALEKFKTKYKLAIISNIDDALFSHSARRLGVPFDWVVTAQQAGAYKPSHRTFEHAFGRIDIPREQILHVAQSIYHDIVPARALGVSSVWVNRRKGLAGSGATVPAAATADVEVSNLHSLASLAGL
jgi:2-haloacid dehalogenase